MRIIVRVMRVFVFVVVFFISLQKSYSQSLAFGNRAQLEVGLALGPSFFLGDLGGNRGIGKTFVKDVNFPYTKFMAGAYGTYYPADWIGVRLAVNYGTIEANDSIIKDKGGWEHDRKQRNLNFRSKVLEGYVALEIYPTVFFENSDGMKGKFRPYGLIGFGAFKFNPKSKYYGPNGAAWVELQPLRLEGQGMAEYPDRKPYSLVAFEIPMGLGFKYYIKENMFVGLELLHRKTFTDYLDDVSKTYIDPALFDTYLSSGQAPIARQMMYRERFYNPTITRPTINQQRGDPSENDSYFSTLIKLGWRLGNWNPQLRQLRCPVYY